jgi:AraC-like DNA-binding protein
MRLRLLAKHILNLKPDADNALLRDEWVIRTLSEAFHPAPPSSGRSPKLVERTKELLHARFGAHLSLKEIADEIGVSPAYLTQEFTRCEGTPLYRYQLQLRLSRALLDLPNCNDITGLALDLGFSNHSHFTSVFRKAFGVTPSEYRSRIGSRRFLLKEDRGLPFGEARRRAA